MTLARNVIPNKNGSQQLPLLHNIYANYRRAANQYRPRCTMIQLLTVSKLITKISYFHVADDCVNR